MFLDESAFHNAFPDILNPTWIRRLFLMVQNTLAVLDDIGDTPDELITTYNTLYRPAVGAYALNRNNSSSQAIT